VRTFQSYFLKTNGVVIDERAYYTGAQAGVLAFMQPGALDVSIREEIFKQFLLRIDKEFKAEYSENSQLFEDFTIGVVAAFEILCEIIDMPASDNTKKLLVAGLREDLINANFSRKIN